jgi:endo-1,4-beta-xylanase
MGEVASMEVSEISLGASARLECYVPDPSIGFHVSRPRPAVIICPGGAYLIHATKEAEPVALEFLSRGFVAFVLRYSVATDREHPERGFDEGVRYPVQALELMEAIHVLRQRSEEMHLTDDIFLMGFSAGGHVCATVGTRWNDERLISELGFVPEGEELRARGMVLGYPMLASNTEDFSGEEFQSLGQATTDGVNKVLYGTTQPDAEQLESCNLVHAVSSDTVPAFLWHSVDDPVVDSRNSTEFVLRMQEQGIPCEYHLFSHGGHGLGLANRYYARNARECDSDIAIWPELAESWMDRLMDWKGLS